MGKKKACRFAPAGRCLAWVGYHSRTNHAYQNKRQNSKHRKNFNVRKSDDETAHVLFGLALCPKSKYNTFDIQH